MNGYAISMTAILRRYAAPVFLPPRVWPKTIWRACACERSTLRRLQEIAGVEPDGIYGPATDRALRGWGIASAIGRIQKWEA